MTCVRSHSLCAAGHGLEKLRDLLLSAVFPHRQRCMIAKNTRVNLCCCSSRESSEQARFEFQREQSASSGSDSVPCLIVTLSRRFKKIQIPGLHPLENSGPTKVHLCSFQGILVYDQRSVSVTEGTGRGFLKQPVATFELRFICFALRQHAC